MRQILLEVEQNLPVLEVRSDDPDVIHSQLEHCLVRRKKKRSKYFSLIFLRFSFRNFIKLYQKSKVKLNTLFEQVEQLLINDRLMFPMISLDRSIN